MTWLSAMAFVVLGPGLGPTPGGCPGTLSAKSCLNGEVCSVDRNRGCQVCQCRKVDEIDTGRDPDDTASPPIPVH